jgi:hypothetical protein
MVPANPAGFHFIYAKARQPTSVRSCGESFVTAETTHKRCAHFPSPQNFVEKAFARQTVIASD